MPTQTMAPFRLRIPTNGTARCTTETDCMSSQFPSGPTRSRSTYLITLPPALLLLSYTHVESLQRIRPHRQTGTKAGPHVWCRWYALSCSTRPSAYPRRQLTVAPLTLHPLSSCVSSTHTLASPPLLPTQTPKTQIQTMRIASSKTPTISCLPVLPNRTTTPNCIGSRSVLHISLPAFFSSTT